MQPEEKMWFSHKGTPYKGNLPPFFDPSKFDWVNTVESSSDKIINEIKGYLEFHADELKPYFNKDLVSKKNAWQLLTLKFWGVESKKSIQNFPELYGCMSKIPGMVTCTISVMEPQTTIKPHIGDTNAVLRCHLGIDIPGKLPACGIKAAEDEQSWSNGKVLLFCDAYMHSAWNHTDQRRIIVIFDVVHELFGKQEKKICTDALALLWIQQKRKNSSFFNKLPGPVLGILMRFRRFYLRVFGLKEFNL